MTFEFDGKFLSAREFSVALIQSFSMMAYGSCMLHGSHTNLGSTMDVESIAIMAYITHQASVENLRAFGNASVVITDLGCYSVIPIVS